jgi:hypothetical protein
VPQFAKGWCGGGEGGGGAGPRHQTLHAHFSPSTTGSPMWLLSGCSWFVPARGAGGEGEGREWGGSHRSLLLPCQFSAIRHNPLQVINMTWNTGRRGGRAAGGRAARADAPT